MWARAFGWIAGCRAPRLTARGWLLLTCGALAWLAAMVLGSPEFGLVAAFLAAILLLTLISLSLPRSTRLSVTRRIDPAAPRVGQRITVTVRAPRHAAAWTPAMFGDTPPQGFDDVMVLDLPNTTSPDTTPPDAESRVVSAYTAVPMARGWHCLPAVRRTVRDALGCWQWTAATSQTQRVLIHPSAVMLPTVARLATPDDAPSDHRMSGRSGWADLTARPYVTGDALSRVHWRTSARVGELMVRPDMTQEEATVSVLLDIRGASYDPGEDGSTQFEWAVSFVASIWESANAAESSTRATRARLLLLSDRDCPVFTDPSSVRRVLAETERTPATGPEKPTATPAFQRPAFERPAIAVTGARGRIAPVGTGRPPTVVTVGADPTRHEDHIDVTPDSGVLTAWQRVEERFPRHVS